MNNQNPFLRGHPRYHRENRNFTEISYPMIRRARDTVSRTYGNVRDAVFSIRAPANFRNEAIYFSVYIHIVCLVAFLAKPDWQIRHSNNVRIFTEYYINILGFNRNLDNFDRVMRLLIQPFFIVFQMFMTTILNFNNPRETTFSGMHYINAYAGLFMIAIYVAFRYYRRNQRQGGSNKTQSKRKGSNKTQSKRKGSNKTQSKKGSFTSLDLSTKTETHISGTVKIDKSNLDKETENEMRNFIKKNLIQVNDSKYKMSFSGLDLIISIEENNVRFYTEFSNKEKFYQISKEIFEINKSLYPETEEDIHNKMNDLDKINLELKMNLGEKTTKKG